MKKLHYGFIISLFILLAFSGAPVLGQTHVITSDLNGFNEVPAISTEADGWFVAELDADGETIDYTLFYENLESPARAAHIHLGQPGVNGGIIVFLCGGEDSDSPSCPEQSGTVMGMLTADDVIGPEEQGISPGEFAEVVQAMLAGATYVNVHSEQFPAGEIRGPVNIGRGAVGAEADQDGDENGANGEGANNGGTGEAQGDSE